MNHTGGLRAAIVSTITTFVLAVSTPARAADYAVLHNFPGYADYDGGYAYGTPIISGSTLYGTTYTGGAGGGGVLFRMEVDGSDYTVLHHFSGGSDDGMNPNTDILTLCGSTLYGMTCYGGNSNMGVIYRIETDGSGYQNIHDFSGGTDDGRNPRGRLAVSGSTLYGTTAYGGSSDQGTLFKVETNGSGFSLLHSFVAPQYLKNWASVIVDGSTLYGIDVYGGANDLGSIYRVDTGGSNFTEIHEFTGGADDGFYPADGPLVLSGSTLYGMTARGGATDDGTIFKIGTDGSGYEILHEFTGGNESGPITALALSGTNLFGTTFGYDGIDDYGAVFVISTDGSGYQVLHEFAGGDDDGRWPLGSVAVGIEGLYGMTGFGGPDDAGVIYRLTLPGALTVPEPGTWLLVGTSVLVLFGMRRNREPAPTSTREQA